MNGTARLSTICSGLDITTGTHCVLCFVYKIDRKRKRQINRDELKNLVMKLKTIEQAIEVYV